MTRLTNNYFTLKLNSVTECLELSFIVQLQYNGIEEFPLICFAFNFSRLRTFSFYFGLDYYCGLLNCACYNGVFISGFVHHDTLYYNFGRAVEYRHVSLIQQWVVRVNRCANFECVDQFAFKTERFHEIHDPYGDSI